ncbi:helix-turn-helix domain-containing protein [Plantactinospora solaniradicis]|uniref:Helix-turn-helix domain-containing protein n=1 Tax=Plantactinospora solaniradicis TaxID=1723736 RepID=A0ABW1K9T0_9ACTN
MSQTRRPHRAIAERVKTLRQGRGWSARELADEMVKVGIPWDRSIVANLETGRRASVSVEEFLALAYVLDVAPVNVLVPTESDVTEFEPVQGQVVDPMTAREWIRGRQPIGDQNMDTYFSKIAGSDFVSIYGALKKAQEARARAAGGDDGNG